MLVSKIRIIEPLLYGNGIEHLEVASGTELAVVPKVPKERAHPGMPFEFYLEGLPGPLLLYPISFEILETKTVFL